MLNEDRKEAGGVCLFESAKELKNFLCGELFATIGNNPAFSNVRTDIFDIAEAASAITGATKM